MTLPYPMPNVGSAGIVQQQGIGEPIQQGLAGVLAQMQQTKENQYRQQELANAQAQQLALQRYYEALAAQQQRELSMKEGEQALIREGQRQAGAAQRAAISSPPPETQGIFGQILQGGALATPPQASLPSIFTGVSDQNMPDAVKAVQEAQALSPQPKAPELPTAAKEEQYYRYLLATDPPRAAAFKKLWLDKQPQNVINVGPGETQYSKSLAEAQVGELKESKQQGKGAAAGFSMIAEAYDRADKALLGIGANVQLGVARALSAMGVPVAKDAVANTQTFQKLTGESALMYLRSRDLGSGTAVSDADREFVAALAGGSIALDRRSIKMILRVNAGAAIMKAQEAVTDMREQAIARPNDAPILTRMADRLEPSIRPMWERYAKMLADEGMSPAAIREKLLRSNVPNAEQIIRTLPKPKPFSVKDAAESLGWGPGAPR